MSFHVLEASRLTTGILASGPADGNNGAFVVESSEPGWRLIVIASDGMGWEHVSVRAAKSADKTRIPTWREMNYIKGIFWDDEDVVVQYHPRRSEYVNNHPHVLHLWRPIGVELPTPPSELVGVLGSNTLPASHAAR